MTETEDSILKLKFDYVGDAERSAFDLRVRGALIFHVIESFVLAIVGLYPWHEKVRFLVVVSWQNVRVSEDIQAACICKDSVAIWRTGAR